MSVVAMRSDHLLEPPGAFHRPQTDRRAMLAAIDAGLLRRTLVLARRE